MTIADRAVLVTGANRGIGQALVEEALRRGAKVTGFAALPLMPACSISKAAAFSLTQSLRALLAGRGVRVHAVLTGPVDTDMIRALDLPKASPESVAQAIFDGVENGEEEIFPDPMSESMAESWHSGAAKALERQNAALVEAEPIKV
jgi:NAD(P)-dependent dehydrogenase (short-subunit alcohol dehydrogenase family)